MPPDGEGTPLWFRGGLVFKAHRFMYHSTLGSIVMKKKKRYRGESGGGCAGGGGGARAGRVIYTSIYIYIYIYMYK